MIRSLELSAPLSILQEGEKGRRGEGRSGVNNGSCLHNEVSIKNPKVQGLVSFQVADHKEVLGEQCAWREHGVL